MSQVENSGEFEMAIATTAYVIASIDEENCLNKERPVEEMEISDISKSKREGNTSTQIYSRGSLRWFTNKEPKDESKSAGDKITRKSAISDQRMQNDSTANQKSAEKTMGDILTINKVTSFTDKYLNDTGSKKFGSGNEARPAPKAQSIIKPTTTSSSMMEKEGNSAKTEADAKEKAETAKIRKGYKNLKSKLLRWGTEKKTKATRKMEQKV